MAVPHPVRGSFTLAQLNRALKAFPSMIPEDRKVVREFFVDGLRLTETAVANVVSTARVRYLCARILGAHGMWVAQTDDQKQQPVARSDNAKKKRKPE